MNIYPLFARAREPLSSFTHFIGACFAATSFVLVILKYSLFPEISLFNFIGALVFCTSMLALYSTSAIYHFIKAKDTILLRLRKLDHAMIYVLIAGSYTPLLIKFLPTEASIKYLIIFWSIALIGILIKVFWMEAPRWLYTSLYLLMGWAVVFNPGLLKAIPLGGLILLSLGGIFYSIGALVYIVKKPNFSKTFGFHEVFHVFVMLGTASHFVMVYIYAL